MYFNTNYAAIRTEKFKIYIGTQGNQIDFFKNGKDIANYIFLVTY